MGKMKQLEMENPLESGWEEHLEEIIREKEERLKKNIDKLDRAMEFIHSTGLTLEWEAFYGYIS